MRLAQAAPGVSSTSSWSSKSVNGRDAGSQQLRVIKDPHSAGSEADIVAQQQMLTALRRDVDATVDAINSAELVRNQVYNLKNIIQDTELKRAADELDKKVIAAEQQLVELRATGRGQDGVRWGVGVDESILAASLKAVVGAVNRLGRVS